MLNFLYIFNIFLKHCSENFFKDAGEVVDVRFAMSEDNSFRGFGHVEFATTEAAEKVISSHLAHCALADFLRDFISYMR